MPKIVDHEARRMAVAQIAAQLIAKNGLEGTKVREIARLADCSTSIVSHYFRDKRDLLMSAYRIRMQETVDLVRIRAGEGSTLIESLSIVLPLDEYRRDSWRIWLAFWGLATSDESFLLEQRRRSREAMELFYRTIVDAGAMEEGPECEIAAQSLLANVSGIAMQSIYDAERWPPERQVEIMALLIERLTARA